MEMCEVCQSLTWRPLTLSQAGSHANLFRRRENGKLKVIRGGCGRNSPVWWMRYDPESSSWRTCPDSSVPAVPRLSLILPFTATMRNGVVSLREMPEHLISDSESLSLPTPTTVEPGFKVSSRNPVDKNGDPVTHPMQRWFDPETGRLMQKGLNQVVEMFPTPTRGDGNSSGSRNTPGSKAHAGTSLTDYVRGDEGKGRQEPEEWRTPQNRDWRVGEEGRDGSDGRQVNLPDQVKIWPTPKASPSGPDYARMSRPDSGGDDLATAVAREVTERGKQETLPTPSATDWKGSSQVGQRRGQLSETVAGGSLNPRWVEWLMGFPDGWTVLED